MVSEEAGWKVKGVYGLLVCRIVIPRVGLTTGYQKLAAASMKYV